MPKNQRDLYSLLEGVEPEEDKKKRDLYSLLEGSPEPDPEDEKKPGLLRQIAGAATELPTNLLTGAVRGIGSVAGRVGKSISALDEKYFEPGRESGGIGGVLQGVGETVEEDLAQMPEPETVAGTVGLVGGTLAGAMAPYVASTVALAPLAPALLPAAGAKTLFAVRSALAALSAVPIDAAMDYGDQEGSAAETVAWALDFPAVGEAYRWATRGNDPADKAAALRVLAEDPQKRTMFAVKAGLVTSMGLDAVMAVGPALRSIRALKRGPGPIGAPPKTLPEVEDQQGLMEMPAWRSPLGEPESVLTIRDRPVVPIEVLRPTGSGVRAIPVAQAAEAYVKALEVAGAPPHEIMAARRLARLHPNRRVEHAAIAYRDPMTGVRQIVHAPLGTPFEAHLQALERLPTGATDLEDVFVDNNLVEMSRREAMDLEGTAYGESSEIAERQGRAMSEAPISGSKAVVEVSDEAAAVSYMDQFRVPPKAPPPPPAGPMPPERLSGVARNAPADWLAVTPTPFQNLKMELQNGEYGILTALDPRAPMEIELRPGETPSQRMAMEIKALGYEEWNILPITGTYQGQPQGTSFFVRGMTAEDARTLGRMFGQEEVIANEGMVRVADGATAPRVGSVQVGEEVAGHEFFSTLWQGDTPVSNFAVSYNFEARIPLDEARAQAQMVLYRYQPGADPRVVPGDPSVRTGVPGREDPRRLNDPAAFMKRTNWYLSEGFAEPGVKQMPYLHRGTVSRARMYDIVADKDNLVGSWNTQTGLDPATYLEQAAAAKGYAGLYNPHAGTANVFEEVLTTVRTNPLLGDKSGAATLDIVRAIAHGGSGALLGGTVGALGSESGNEVESFFKGALVGTLAASGLSAPGRKFVLDLASKNPITAGMAKSAQYGLNWVILPRGNAPEAAFRARLERDNRLAAHSRVVQMLNRRIKAAKPTAAELDDIAHIANNVPARKAIDGWARHTFATMQMPPKLRKGIEDILDSDPLPSRVDEAIGSLWEEGVIDDVAVYNDLRAHLRRLANISRDYSSLRPELRGPVQEFVAGMDTLRRELIASGAVQGDMLTVFDLNSDVYLTRGFAHFENPDAWKKFVNPGPDNWFYKHVWNRLRGDGQPLYNDTVRWVRDRYPNMSAVEAQNMVNDMLVPEDSPFATMARMAPATRAKINVLFRRGDIPEVMRRLWGEDTDPVVQLSQSYHAMAAKAVHYDFVSQLRKEGEGVFLWDAKNRPDSNVQKTIEIPSGNPSWRPVEGMFITPEAMKMLQGHKQIEFGPWRWIQAGNTIARGNKTVRSITTQTRNVIGNNGFLGAQGYMFHPIKLARAVSRGKNVALAGVYGTGEQLLPNWGYGAGMRTQDYMADLVREGILGQNPVSRELDRLKDDVLGKRLQAMGANVAGLSKLGKAGAATVRKASQGVDLTDDLYRAGDDWSKVASFEMEFERYLPILGDRMAAKAKAVQLVRGHLPNYDMVSPFIIWLRQVPVLGPFVSFNYEIYRTTFNTLTDSQLEILNPDPRIKKIGYERLAGFAATAAAAPVAALGSKAMFGMSQEDENNARYLLPEWSENSNIFWLPKGLDGKRRYIDMSYTDPFGNLNHLIPLILRGEGPELIAKRAMLEVGYQFFGEELFWKALKDVTIGEKAASLKNQGGEEWFRTFFGTLLDAVEPAAYEQIARAIEGHNNVSMGDSFAGKRPTRTMNRGLEALSMVSGMRVSTLDPAESLKFALYGLQQDFDQAGTKKREAEHTVEKIEPGEMKQIGDDFRMRGNNIAAGYRRKVEAAIRLGVPVKEVREMMRYSVRDAKVREYLLGNTEWPYGVAP